MFIFLYAAHIELPQVQMGKQADQLQRGATATALCIFRCPGETLSQYASCRSCIAARDREDNAGWWTQAWGVSVQAILANAAQIIRKLCLLCYPRTIRINIMTSLVAHKGGP